MTSWQRWSATDIGNRRAQNEDALVCNDYDGLWAVIDGMGGINAGNVASSALAHAIEHMTLRPSLADAVDQIEDLVLAVHDQLHDFSQQETPRRTLGCTLALMRLTQTWGLLAWVGDVRVYRWREQTLTRLTQDHLGPEQELTRLIGDGELLPDFALVRAQPGDRYLLCSDGLHNEIADARLAYWLAHEPEIAQRELVAEALAAGGRDNLSFIILDVDAMTTAQDDLKEVNAALCELVRLQLAGELPAEAAWQARRQMLDSVEMAWHDLSQDLTPEALVSRQLLTAPEVPRVSLRERWQQLPRLALPSLSLPSLSLPSPSWRPSLPKLQSSRVLDMLLGLPWWILFLLAALSSFYYVSTL